MKKTMISPKLEIIRVVYHVIETSGPDAVNPQGTDAEQLAPDRRWNWED